MCYAHAMGPEKGYGSAASATSLRALAGMGVNWISITPFAFQRRPDDTEMRWFRGASSRGESDDRLLAVTRQAHGLGIKVMLKPHVWLRPPDWPGSIDPATTEGWRAWFRSYREFIVHYAELAQGGGMDGLCIGNELAKTTAHEAQWREIVSAVRAAYRGPLTYGAAADEVFTVPFWDALDFIGVSAYYPLVDGRAPSRAALVEAWQPIVRRLAALADRWQRPIVFTEAGYRSADFGAWRNWEVGRDAPVNLTLQADAYAALFDAVWKEPWFGGVYWWKWFSHPDHSGPESNDFELEGKPAAEVVRRFYRDAARPARLP
jgi:hypothetical protein